MRKAINEIKWAYESINLPRLRGFVAILTLSLLLQDCQRGCQIVELKQRVEALEKK